MLSYAFSCPNSWVSEIVRFPAFKTTREIRELTPTFVGKKAEVLVATGTTEKVILD